MKQKLKEYKAKLEKGLADYMQMPVSERSALAVRAMVECWEELTEMEKHLCSDHEFTREDAEAWNKRMVNEDGTTGGHWTVEQTDAVAEAVGVRFEHVSPYCWNAAMNMMYSDYYKAAEKYQVSTPTFYAELAKAFLFDADAVSPRHKLGAYYKCIVDRE